MSSPSAEPCARTNTPALRPPANARRGSTRIGDSITRTYRWNVSRVRHAHPTSTTHARESRQLSTARHTTLPHDTRVDVTPPQCMHVSTRTSRTQTHPPPAQSGHRQARAIALFSELQRTSARRSMQRREYCRATRQHAAARHAHSALSDAHPFPRPQHCFSELSSPPPLELYTVAPACRLVRTPLPNLLPPASPPPPPPC
jgi:hypothetical protein